MLGDWKGCARPAAVLDRQQQQEASFGPPPHADADTLHKPPLRRSPSPHPAPHFQHYRLACTMGTRPVSRQSTESSTQCVTQYARSRISMTCGGWAGWGWG